MRPFEQDTQVFIVRFWIEPRELPGTHPIWRGVVEHLSSRERFFFDDLNNLVAILQPHIAHMVVSIQRGSETMPNLSISAQPTRSSPFSPTATSAAPLTHLQPLLAALDRRLAEAVLAAQSAYGMDAAQDPYRGLYISADEVTRLLRREPAAPILAPPASPPLPAGVPATELPGRFMWLGRWFRKPSVVPIDIPPPVAPPPPPQPPLVVPEAAAAAQAPLRIDPEPDSPLAWLAQQHGLDDFDLAVLLVALAPELDTRYERLYAYLQDDVSRRQPSVNLALNLLCMDAEEQAARRAHFAPDAPLRRSGLLQLTPDRAEEQPSLLARVMQLDDYVARVLLGEYTLDARLAPFTQLVAAATRNADGDDDALLALLEDAWDNGRPLRVYFHGPPGSGRQQRAERLAAELGTPLLVVDLAGALAADKRLAWVPQRIFREAFFHSAWVYLRGFDLLRGDERSAALEQLWAAMTRDDGITFLDGTQLWSPLDGQPGGVLTIAFPLPGYQQRRAQWHDRLAEAGVELDEHDLDALAGRFRLSPSQIADACATAINLARWHAATRGDATLHAADPTLDDLFAAARAQTGHTLAALAHKIEPLYTWDDLVLPRDAAAQLHEICERIAHGTQVLEQWGFERKISQGKGTTALFAGPSGTGKTMAAEVIAADLGLDLYRIDLSSVVSKYIGETEKNLERIFQAAENTNAILFFDEADALFGKRSEVRDSHDRYANIEISYLLQKMETYDGLAILATNLRQNLDDAFVRRLAFTVSFPFPDEASRLAIWQGIWPDDLPRAFDDEDMEDLAARFKLAGGNIKNVALAAAYLAASEHARVGREHVLRAVQREYQKMGKTLSEEELRGVELAQIT